MVKLARYEAGFFKALSYNLDDVQSDFTRSVGLCINTRKDLEDPQKNADCNFI